MTLAIVSSHRDVPPHGLFGGEPGECGATYIRGCDGGVRRLAGCEETAVKAGEAVILHTPTGGGFGAALQPEAMVG